MANFLDYDGLLYFYNKLKTKFNKVDPATTAPVMDGTAATGSSANYARADHVHPTDTSRAPTSHASTATTYGKGTSSNYGHVKLSDSTSSTTAAASGGTAATPKAVKDALDAAKTYADGLEASDFVGATTSAAGTHGLVPAPAAYTAGYMDVLCADGTWKQLTHDLYGSSNNLVIDLKAGGSTISRLSISGANIVSAIGTNSVRYADRATSDANGNNIASTYATLDSPALTGTPTAPTATADTNSTQIATTEFVTTAIANATAGAVAFKGTLGSSTSTATYTQDTLEASSYEAGWYWVVNAGGTYVGKNCGVGDMVYAIAAKGNAYSASDFTVVQNEMDAITNAQIDTITAS